MSESAENKAGAEAAMENRVSTGTMGKVSLAVLSSRILGLVREILMARWFGGDNRRWYECFLTAFRLPNMLRDLFAEGALSTAFVTTFSKTHQTQGESAAWALARKMVTLTAVFMSLISLLGVVFAPWLVRVMSPGWVRDNPDKVDYAVQLAQIMYPFILLVSLAALVMGMLNARKVFFVPAMSSHSVRVPGSGAAPPPTVTSARGRVVRQATTDAAVVSSNARSVPDWRSRTFADPPARTYDQTRPVPSGVRPCSATVDGLPSGLRIRVR